MGILSWLIVGLIAGWLANMVMRGGRGNVVTDIIVGIIGAIVGGFLAGQLFDVPNAVNGINLTSIVIAFLGAIVAIAIVRALPDGGCALIITHGGIVEAGTIGCLPADAQVASGAACGLCEGVYLTFDGDTVVNHEFLRVEQPGI